MTARIKIHPLVWTLSAVLAIVFFLAGLPKLFGASVIGFQAAAMSGFPQWVRLVVGAAEVAGAIGLLIPATASVAALLLALAMIPASLTQYASGDGSAYLPLVIFVMLVIVAWFREPDVAQRVARRITHGERTLVREGITAGLIGAAATALWVLIVDGIDAHPLRTPAVLGHGLLALFGPGNASDGMVQYVALYSAFHLITFILVGLGASLLIRGATHEPSVLLGIIILFAVIEVGSYGLVSVMGQASSLRSLAWYQLMVGNLIASSSMALYFWRGHRHLTRHFRRSFEPGLSPGETIPPSW